MVWGLTFSNNYRNILQGFIDSYTNVLEVLCRKVGGLLMQLDRSWIDEYTFCS